VFSGHRHVPIAALAPEIAERTVTLLAPSKTYNIPGLKCSVGIASNDELRRQIKASGTGLVPGVNLMGYVAALAAYRDGGPWLDEVLRYLEANRDFVLGYVREHLPGISAGPVEGTYLAWLDCRAAGIPGNPYRFFLKHAGVALSDGIVFGRGGEGFVRLNFGCPRATLGAALDRMKAALCSF